MKKSFMVVVALVFVSVVIQARQVDEFLRQLSVPHHYSAKVDFEVTLPITFKDVDYRVKVYAVPTQGDTLCQVKYLVETTDSAGGINFYSYFDGNYFRFAHSRLQEYHYDYDAEPFRDSRQDGRYSQAVQNSGMFVQLIPSLLSSELRRLVNTAGNEAAFTADTLVRGKRAAVLRINEYIRGVPSRELEYVFTVGSHEPIYYHLVSNPGGVGEQTVEAQFTTVAVDSIPTIDESALIDRYNGLFERYRTGNYSADSMKDRPMSMFSLPSTAGERYTWNAERSNPALVVFLDSRGSMTSASIKAIRDAVAEMPLAVSVIWIFTDKDMHGIEAVMPNAQTGEHALMNGKRLATECGVTGCPTILMINRKGIVENVIVGFNNKLKSDVIQQTVFTVR